MVSAVQFACESDGVSNISESTMTQSATTTHHFDCCVVDEIGIITIEKMRNILLELHKS